MTEPYAPDDEALLAGTSPVAPSPGRVVAPELPDPADIPVAPDLPATHGGPVAQGRAAVPDRPGRPAAPDMPAAPGRHAAPDSPVAQGGYAAPPGGRNTPPPPGGRDPQGEPPPPGGWAAQGEPPPPLAGVGPGGPPVVDGAALGAELSTAVILFHEAIGHRLGLSAADQRALGIIGGRGPMTAGALAQLTGLSPGAVTGLVDRLERGGHVTRSADPGDRRRIVITAVPSPEAGVGEAFARLSAQMTALVSRYDARESAAILDYLQQTIAILREQTRLLSDQ